MVGDGLALLNSAYAIEVGLAEGDGVLGNQLGSDGITFVFHTLHTLQVVGACAAIDREHGDDVDVALFEEVS